MLEEKLKSIKWDLGEENLTVCNLQRQKLMQADNSPVTRGMDYRGDMKKATKNSHCILLSLGFHAQKTVFKDVEWMITKAFGAVCWKSIAVDPSYTVHL